MKQCSVYLPEDLLQSYRDLNTHVPLSTRLKLLLEDFVIGSSISVTATVIDPPVFTFVGTGDSLGVRTNPPNTSDGAAQ